MTTGLLALLDDITALAKMAAATLDDAAAQSAKAASKAAGIVIDDTAVTPRYVVGLAPERELPIIGKIAAGSLRNKLVILLPAALLLKALAPWVIMPLLMAGGLFLCYEGYHKVVDLAKGPAAEGPDGKGAATSPEQLERERVAGAIRTDFILSAEIMAIALSGIPDAPLWLQGTILAAVGTVMTAGVYGMVAMIVKADDAGMWMSRSPRGAVRWLGCALVRGMPWLLRALSFASMLAMLWVGGGILLHGAAELGWKGPEHGIHEFAVAMGARAGSLSGFAAWLVQAAIGGVIGLAAGALTAPAIDRTLTLTGESH